MLERVRIGKDASYKYLRVSEYGTFVYVPKDDRSKFNVNNVFLYCAYEELGYRLWEFKNKKAIKIRDVIFLENQTIIDLKKFQKLKSFNKHSMNLSLSPMLSLIVAIDDDKDE